VSMSSKLLHSLRCGLCEYINCSSMHYILLLIVTGTCTVHVKLWNMFYSTQTIFCCCTHWDSLEFIPGVLSPLQIFFYVSVNCTICHVNLIRQCFICLFVTLNYMTSLMGPLPMPHDAVVVAGSIYMIIKTHN